MEPVIKNLSNGARLLILPMPAIKSVTVLALVNAGRRYEPNEWAGISHFLEHMVFKGTQKFANSRELSAVIDNVGGEFNAFTSKEYTGYYVRLASRYTDIALDVVSDMLCTPLLRAEDIARESQVIREEINMYDDMPMRRVSDAYDELMFAGTNLAGDVLGEKEIIANLNRDNFVEYINNWYGFKNVVIVVAGDESVVADESLTAKIEQYFSKGGSDRQAKAHQDYFKADFNVYGSDRKKVVFKETEQAHFILGLPTFPRSDDRKYSLSLLSTLLGRTMSSRLFSEIRDNRGLCYYIRSGTDFYHDGGTLTASAGVDPNRIHEAIAATKQEFLQLLDRQPVTQVELDSAKKNTIGGLLLELEDTQSVAFWYGMRLLLDNEIITEQEVISKIEQVSLEQVQSLVGQIINQDQLRLALIGPYQENEINV